MNKKDYHSIVFCPMCKKRALDVMSPIEGTVRIKCPNCHNFVTIDLQFKRDFSPIKYRLQIIA